MTDAMEILVVEDKDSKFSDVSSAIIQLFPDAKISRAQTVIEAENLLGAKPWAILVLDISMDINGTSRGRLGGGHANLGGLDILDGMYLEGVSIPTIVVTGFDYFPSPGIRDAADFIGLQELEQLVRRRLPGAFLGCLRYGISGWRDKFLKAIKDHSGDEGSSRP